ncbi:murein biosynthesis integral membrane protein MurJ [Candidatus Uhrbacteria bacterium RIFCSPLOWO2_01_FULL_47_24]|uniref:Probable lipid II flippase MurJ n=1 Tax=Candidatus Uhrbacteria bacterium RIFCSPLOWO2_01_FULL_47_24 TaxID=1802401 RepID=A0A1F7USD8_9BACT|nr:MAG: murein biosynthesis integral membrane protein MurJ [Candidatus Uhrbacteria bacterium RIFCSPHIGHO2_02_FULL_46_47]OGL76293.1 MAG: murein biosynthesis integral membrane protein MurJ [Candidatus Uhrbacteria bacterium RIFCSPHIGHO2_12_FULL_47_11]OGL81212.1 MAG: murein biosynthesis integral membrane protein MurJ [Candidatus Uhrbacteria bacterium RIFCSPLOWO2_01_FULL_47_24]OGL84624.1 MAG: murein biosynthesis integral membrane protein MurJ [Candidatus Uhrbacteria bacterium RIFCSPLOWO2_02_FULL_46_2
MVQWFNSKIESIAGAAVILAGASFASKILGLLRNRVLAGAFGASDTLDAYYAAFRIPDAIFQFVVLGALSAGFIPVFMELMAHTPSPQSSPSGRGQGEGNSQWQVASTVLNALVIILAVFATVFAIFAPQLQMLIAPGFNGEKLALTIQFARIMALSPIFLGISAVFSGILQSYRRFVIYALAPLFYNVGIIFGALWLVPIFGVLGLALGVVIGALMHMAVQIPNVRRVGFRWRPILDLKSQAVRKIGVLSMPRLLGLAVTQVNLFAITLLASKLSSGSLSIFNLANDIQSVPIGLFAISLATAAFPAFSEFATRKDNDGFRKSFSSTARLILFLTIPFAILLLLLRAQVVRVLLGSGKFDWADTIATADTLAFFSLSLFAQALLPLLARASYALKDTLSPLLAGAAGVAANVILALYFRGPFGIAGLALAFSFAMLINLGILWLMLRARLRSLDEAQIVPALFKISGAALAMALVVQATKYWLAPQVNMQTGVGVLTQGFVSGTLGLTVFLITALAMGSDEARAIKNAFTKRLFRGKDVRPVEIVEPRG